jgi:hypothetical protein
MRLFRGACLIVLLTGAGGCDSWYADHGWAWPRWRHGGSPEPPGTQPDAGVDDAGMEGEDDELEELLDDAPALDPALDPFEPEAED